MPNGNYRARVTYDGRQYMVGSYFTVGDAKAALAIARSEIARKIFVPPVLLRHQRRSQDMSDRASAITVREWADDWLVRLEGTGRAPGTIRSYRSTLDAHVLPAIGDKRLPDVTSLDIEAMLGGIATKGAWTNAARTTRSLFLAAMAAKVGGLVESPVTVTISKPRRKASSGNSEDIATPTEVRAMADTMPAQLKISVHLAAWCALRLGEVLGLQRRDFDGLEDGDGAVVHVRRQWNSKVSPPGYTEPKAGSRRTIAVPASLVPLITEHLDKHVPAMGEAPLLPSPARPTVPISQTRFDQAWRTAREGARPGFRFHALRHTGLTEYARAGATLRELQERGGHLSVEVALGYQHAGLERDRANVAKMDAVITNGA